MFKAVCTLIAGLISVAPALASAQPALNASVSGVCGLNNRSGYLIVDEAGNLVDLVDYCRRHQNQLESRILPSTPGSSAFWQAFEASASPEAIVVADSLGAEEVVAYASTICPFLEQGGSLPELRQIQGDGHLPTSFEVAVTYAAINTYCPAFRSEIGRRGR
ncbi:hypothetical protein [Egbenema bharatensis]|uniref:hypothetical protein n=1 Tax=Egbenema bharatensis TaxID=3463334 RepID=UPI003A8807E7